MVADYTQWRTTRRLQETDSAPRCEFSEAGSGEIGVLVFIGNLVLVAVILLTLFFLHVALASGAEAYWLTKVNLPNVFQSSSSFSSRSLLVLACRTGLSIRTERVHYIGVGIHTDEYNRLMTLRVCVYNCLYIDQDWPSGIPRFETLRLRVAQLRTCQ